MRPLLLFCVLLAACAGSKPLPRLGDVPEFVLVDHSNRKFTRAALDGHVWIADFIYTTCQGPCPRMSSRMRAIQDATSPDIRLVSFTVDPDNDTPAVLSEYARKFASRPERWSFLTGDKNTLNTLDHDAFKLGSIGVDMDHSTRFVLVDKKSRIRGYYGITQENLVDKIAEDAGRLEKESD